MPKIKTLALTVAILAVFAISAMADDSESKSTDAKGTNAAVANPPSKKSQNDVASKTAKFDTIPSTNETYKTALDAHT